MAVPLRPAVLQFIRYPRRPAALNGTPFHGLLSWGFGNPEPFVQAAELVIAVDVMSGEQLLVYGEVKMFPVEFGGSTAIFTVLVVELDFDTEELDALAALVEQVKGDHDLPWELD